MPQLHHTPNIMAKRTVPLSDLELRNAKARATPYKLADSGGLYLEGMPSGSKMWRLKYRQLSGKENRRSFGAYPQVSLNEARVKRADARKLIADGIDPARASDADARRAKEAAGNTFEVIAREWHRTYLGVRSSLPPRPSGRRFNLAAIGELFNDEVDEAAGPRR